MKASSLLRAASLLVLLSAPSLAPAQSSSGTVERAGLPDGPGKDLVQGICSACHQVREIQRSLGYTREGWDELTASMIDMKSAPDQQKEVLDYLAQNFPPSARRAAKIIPGPYQIDTRAWKTIKLGQRARDPVEGPDGMIWYVGQWGNVIGRIDPQTDKVQEWDLPDSSFPHSVVIDKSGGVWFLGNGNGTIGKFDPATGTSTVFKMPVPDAKDPHTGEFDNDSVFWFSLQQSDMIGRFDPATGETKLVKTKKNAKPYGIKFTSDGTPWVACNGAPCLYKVDRKTMELTEIKLPLPGTTVRRIDIGPDDRVWYVNSGRGRLGVYDPVTGIAKEWDSPSGRTSHPYGIAVIDGIVWYNESNVRPDMLVRFDPKTEKFQSWPIPSGGIHAGIVRHMRATKEGNLLIHQSSTNRITLVTPRPPLTR